MRLAIFVDQVFWQDANALSTNESYVLFFEKFLGHVDEIVFIGRGAPYPGQAPFSLDDSRISLHPLPYYSSLYQLWRKDPKIYSQIQTRVRADAKNWDALLVHGPHPIGQLIARQCITLGVPVVPVLRQNLVQMMRAHRGIKRLLATGFAMGLELDFKRLARGRATLTVGDEMAIRYRSISNEVHTFMPCLVDDAQFRALSTLEPSEDAGRIITVGRLSPEKGHAILLEALALLKTRGLTCKLDIVGSGPLENSLRQLVTDLSLTSQVTFHGFVSYGPALFELYRQAGAAVFPSSTEGLPQVINEALSVGLPTIATKVGGIPGFLKDGIEALLVPPSDVPALADAIERLVKDDELRSQLRASGRSLMSQHTLEANRSIVMKVIQNAIDARSV